MNIPLTTTELVHIADLLREDVMACNAIAEEHPLDVQVLNSIELSKGIMVKITLSSLEPEKNDDYPTKPKLFSQRPHLN